MGTSDPPADPAPPVAAEAPPAGAEPLAPGAEPPPGAMPLVPGSEPLPPGAVPIVPIAPEPPPEPPPEPLWITKAGRWLASWLFEEPVELRALRPRAFLMFAAVYLWAFPYFGQLRSANELPRVLMTQEIVERGVFRLDARMSELGSTFDIAPAPGPHYYSNKAPGASLFAVPVYLVLKLIGKTSTFYSTWAFRLCVTIIPSIIFLYFFYRLSRRFSTNESAVRLGLVAFAFASPAMPYALLFMSHMPAAVTAGGAFCAAVALVRGEARRPVVAALATGALGATSVTMDYQSFIAALWVGLYVVVCSRRRVRDTALVLAGTLPPGALLAYYHHVSFGSALKTGYSLSNPVHSEGFLGLVGPSQQAAWHTFFDPSNGFLILAPWMVLSVVGFIVVMARREARRRAGAEAVVCLLVLGSYLLFMSSLVPSFSRAGWCVGPRYMTMGLPFAGWLAVAGFDMVDRFLPLRVAAKGTVLASAVIFVAAATTYPHWPERFANPVYELTFRLIAEGYAPHTLGEGLGMSGLASLLPVYTFAAGIAFWLISGHRRRVIGAALACVLAVGIVAQHRKFPGSGAYAEQGYGYITGTWEPKKRRR